ncbi:MAG: molybdopterin synthase sulfur carrier subunit [Thermoplasmata archaeon]|nr:MAG: molybdopterin synthase sulfur carrier subunit [Thermoplasmata archaeon]RLF33338.1 MAG: molybdopterin synthase sulfur carrier subunit [Thermoplasmata archaeon]
MNIKIRAFGRYKDLMGKSEIKIKLKKGKTIWDVIDLLTEKYPILEKEKRFIIVSRNHTYASLETKLQDGDVITIFPPIVSGG